VVRFFILRAHYRSPLNYSDQHLEDAKAALTRLYTALRGVELAVANVDWNANYPARFKAALDDDFNTPEALAVLFDLAGEVNKSHDALLAGLLKVLAGVLGFLQRNPEDFLQGNVGVVEAVLATDSLESSITYGKPRIEMLIEERLEAKKAKDFKRADSIRDELKAAGIVLEDSAQGTLWRRG
jgi:cysteinyl-tRNA synthetase